MWPRSKERGHISFAPVRGVGLHSHVKQPRILVVRGGAIGDFIMTLPAIGALRERWPEAQKMPVRSVSNPQLGVVTRPAGMTPGFARVAEVTDNVAVRVEQAHLWHREVGKVTLAAAFAQQVLDLKFGGLVVSLRTLERRPAVGHRQVWL